MMLAPSADDLIVGAGRARRRERCVSREDGIRLAQRLPAGKFVTVPRAGHTVPGDNPKDLVAELRRFLSGDN
jgi:pimeloyl-ACP methyl ester carboxylesterase